MNAIIDHQLDHARQQPIILTEKQRLDAKERNSRGLARHLVVKALYELEIKRRGV